MGQPARSREAEAKQVVERLGLDVAAFSFSGPYAGIGSERTLVEQAWHLGDLAAQYQDFIQEFAGPVPSRRSGAARARSAWCTSGGVSRRWTRSCPRMLLPPDWIGIRAANVFSDLHQAWHQSSQRHWDTLCAAEE